MTTPSETSVAELAAVGAVVVFFTLLNLLEAAIDYLRAKADESRREKRNRNGRA